MSKGKSFFSLRKTVEGNWEWVVYAYNFREIVRSSRGYNEKHHAAGAARRFHKLISGADFDYGKEFKR